MREESANPGIQDLAHCPDCSQDRPLFEFASTRTGEITYHDWLFCILPDNRPNSTA